MKWLSLLLAVVLTLIFGLPFREYDTAQLLPLRTVQADVTPRGVRIVSEAGAGEGATWADAVEDLRKIASGEVFFDTAEQVILCDRSLIAPAVGSGDLRPAAQVYFADALREPDGLHEYLSAHESPLTVADLRAELRHREGACARGCAAVGGFAALRMRRTPCGCNLFSKFSE